MEKVVVFMDYANINAAGSQRKCRIDYAHLLDYLANPEEGRFLQEAFAYVPIDPRREHAMDERVRELWDLGYLVKSKVGIIAGQTYKCDFDVEMTLDMSRAAFELKPDIVVLVSGDSDFVPVVLELRSKGIRVEVASFSESASNLLRHRCSGFINLDQVPELNGGGAAPWFEAVPIEEDDADYETILIPEEWQEKSGWADELGSDALHAEDVQEIIFETDDGTFSFPSSE